MSYLRSRYYDYYPRNSFIAPFGFLPLVPYPIFDEVDFLRDEYRWERTKNVFEKYGPRCRDPCDWRDWYDDPYYRRGFNPYYRHYRRW